jgi:hypothetical protein
MSRGAPLTDSTEAQNGRSNPVEGGDPQLDAAIEFMLEEIEANPYRPVPIPEFPDRSGMGIPEPDW